MSFSLLSKNWIPVRQDGTFHSIGLLQLFRTWEIVQDVCAANPPRQIALYRFLIAIVHAALRGPSSIANYQALWEDESLGERICGYLEQWRARFDLMHPEQPFLQDVTISTTVGEIPIGKAVYQDANTPIIWFKPTDTPWLSLADAAQELLRMQALELGGRKSDLMTVGAGRWTQGRHVFPTSSSLRETLLLNLAKYESTEADCPVWERLQPYGTTDRYPDGYLDWLTYCERRILLTVQGDKVTHLRLASGWKTPSGTGFIHDQHQAFRLAEKSKTWFPVSFDPQKQLWEDSEAILHTIHGQNHRPRIFDWLSDTDLLPGYIPLPVRVIGFAHAGGTQAAKPVHWVDDRLAVPKAILEDADVWWGVDSAIRLARNFGDIFRSSIVRLAPSPLSKGDRETLIAQLPSLRAALYSYVGQQFSKLLRQLIDVDQAPDCLELWRSDLQRYSKLLVDMLINIFPHYRSRAIIQSMFSIAMHKLVKEITDEPGNNRHSKETAPSSN